MQYDSIQYLYPRSMKELRNPPVGASLPWMPKTTEFMGGLRPNEVTLLCAPTGTGKTELLASIASQLAMSGIPTFVAPVETGNVDFTSRVISTVSKKNLNHGLQVGEAELTEIELYNGAKIRNMPLFIANYDNRVSVKEICEVVEYAHTENGVQVALLDNLNFFLEISSASEALIKMDQAIHDLVIFAKRVPIHTILIVHPRKTDGGRVESEYDIKGSSTAVQECPNIALFNRPTKEQIDSGHLPNHRELVFKKIRKRGYYVNKSIWLSYQNGHYTEVTDAVSKPFRSSYKGKPNVSRRDD